MADTNLGQGIYRFDANIGPLQKALSDASKLSADTVRKFEQDVARINRAFGTLRPNIRGAAGGIAMPVAGGGSLAAGALGSAIAAPSVSSVAGAAGVGAAVAQTITRPSAPPPPPPRPTYRTHSPNNPTGMYGLDYLYREPKPLPPRETGPGGFAGTAFLNQPPIKVKRPENDIDSAMRTAAREIQSASRDSGKSLRALAGDFEVVEKKASKFGTAAKGAAGAILSIPVAFQKGQKIREDLEEFFESGFTAGRRFVDSLDTSDVNGRLSETRAEIERLTQMLDASAKSNFARLFVVDEEKVRDKLRIVNEEYGKAFKAQSDKEKQERAKKKSEEAKEAKEKEQRRAYETSKELEAQAEAARISAIDREDLREASEHVNKIAALYSKMHDEKNEYNKAKIKEIIQFEGEAYKRSVKEREDTKVSGLKNDVANERISALRTEASIERDLKRKESLERQAAELEAQTNVAELRKQKEKEFNEEAKRLIDEKIEYEYKKRALEEQRLHNERLARAREMFEFEKSLKERQSAGFGVGDTTYSNVSQLQAALQLNAAMSR